MLVLCLLDVKQLERSTDNSSLMSLQELVPHCPHSIAIVSTQLNKRYAA